MVDDEIFQGVSFAAVKEQLLLLGHDLPDHVIMAYLDEGSAAEPHAPGPQTSAQPCAEDLEGREPAAGSCSSAADSGRDPLEDLSAAEADALDRASSEPFGTRRSAEYVNEDLLAALRLSSKVEDPCGYGALLDEDDPSWQHFDWSDAAATLRVSARAVLSPLAPKQWQTSWRRGRHGSAEDIHACREHGAAVLQQTVNGARTSGNKGSAVHLASPGPGPSPQRHAGGATGVLSPPLESAADLVRPARVGRAACSTGAGQAEQAGSGDRTACAPACANSHGQHSTAPPVPDARGASPWEAGALRRQEPDQARQAARSGRGACSWEGAAWQGERSDEGRQAERDTQGARPWEDAARRNEEPDQAQHAARSAERASSWDAAALRGEGSDLAPGAHAEARSGGTGAAAEDAEGCSSRIGYSAGRASVLPRPEYYDVPRSSRYSGAVAPPPWRSRIRHAVTSEYGAHAHGEAARGAAYAASGAAHADDDAAHQPPRSGRHCTDRRKHSPERRERSAKRRSGSPRARAPRPASAALSASGSGSRFAGASAAHDPARNRALLAAAARKPPCVDRVARYLELKRIWDSDPFLRAGGGGAVPGVHRPPAGFREAFEAAHAAEAEERAYWARYYAAGGGAYGSNTEWYE